jgi:hypothetical protein
MNVHLSPADVKKTHTYHLQHNSNVVSVCCRFSFPKLDKVKDFRPADDMPLFTLAEWQQASELDKKKDGKWQPSVTCDYQRLFTVLATDLVRAAVLGGEQRGASIRIGERHSLTPTLRVEVRHASLPQCS